MRCLPFGQQPEPLPKRPSREPENGSLVLRPGEDGKGGPVLVKRGPLKPEEGCGGGFHDCKQTDFHDSGDLCASCHQVYHYDKHYPLEATYLEWEQQPYARRRISTARIATWWIMKRLSEVPIRWPNRSVREYRHYFNGAN
ncbi:MAG: hypothetical protein U5J82_10480 [Desulfobacterales bacterium]|nr:hypothetical protein [Desulfobacterales bacterium]